MQQRLVISAILHPQDRIEHYLRHEIWRNITYHMGANIFKLKGPYTFCRNWSQNIIAFWSEAQEIFCNRCVKQMFQSKWLDDNNSLNLKHIETILSSAFDWRLFLNDKQFSNAIIQNLLTFNRKEHYAKFRCHCGGNDGFMQSARLEPI